MNDLRDDLRRARGMAPRSTLDLERLIRRRGRTARRKRVSAITLSMAITIAMIGGVLILAQGLNGSTGSVADGSDELDDAELLSRPTIDLSLAQGEYAYRRITTYPSDGGVPTTVAVWWALDDSGRLRYSAGDDTTYGPGQLPTDSGPVAHLSTDPDELFQQMLERTGPGGASPEPSEQFTPGPAQSDHTTAGLVRAIGELLDDWNTSPALRAALVGVLAALEGVQVTPGVSDPVGRPAILLSVTTEEALHSWWVDPDSLQLLARQDGPGPSAGGAVIIVESAGITTGTDSSQLTTNFIPSSSSEPTSS